MIIETETVETGRYTINKYVDEFSDAPWENMDTFGTVTDWENRDKAPGELILSKDGTSKRFYDFQEAVKNGRLEGLTGEKAVSVARNEYEYLRRWCNNHWFYIGIEVGDKQGRKFSLWGIESDAEQYHDEVVKDLISELRHQQERETNPIACCGV